MEMNVVHIALGFGTFKRLSETSKHVDARENEMSQLHECFCPQCNSLLDIEHIIPRSLAYWEYRGHCNDCGWTDTLQRIWCDSCDQLSFGSLIDEGLKCLRCGRIIQLLTA